MKKISFAKLLFFLVLIITVGLIGVLLAPQLIALESLEDAEELVESIRGFGVFSVFIFLGLQVIQIIIFVIPGEVMEIIAGLIFGSFFGTVLCLVGVTLGSSAIFAIAKWLGFDSLRAIFSKDSSKLMAYLEQDNRLYVVLFLLFFIPGVPRDALTYFIPFIPISLKNFLSITLVARLPSIISSTYLGSAIFDGNILPAIIVYVAVGLLAFVGYFVHRKMKKTAKEN